MPISIADLEALAETLGPGAQQLWREVKRDVQFARRVRTQGRKRWHKWKATNANANVSTNVSLAANVRLTPKKVERKKDPSLPLTDLLVERPISARSKGKRPLPSDWTPVVALEDAAELQRFKDYAKANGKLYADWDAAWRNWRTSPYRNANGNGAQHGKAKDDYWSDEQFNARMRARTQPRTRFGSDRF